MQRNGLAEKSAAQIFKIQPFVGIGDGVREFNADTFVPEPRNPPLYDRTVKEREDKIFVDVWDYAVENTDLGASSLTNP